MMRSVLKRSQARRSNQGSNAFAAMIAGGAFALLYFGVQPHAMKARAEEAIAMIETTTQSDSQAKTTAQEYKEIVPLNDLPSAEKQNTETTIVGGISGKYALMLGIELLEDGQELLSKSSGYRSLFLKQELINDVMTDTQNIDLKVQHGPFSVYMKWKNFDKGREVLYVEGENDDRMLCHAGGWKARFLPTMKLDPNGSMAMSEARHPITEAGLLKLVDMLLEARRNDLKNPSQVVVHLEDGHEYDGRPCIKMINEYHSKAQSEIYRRTEILIDTEMSIPVLVENFAWPLEGQEATPENTLLESYGYQQIQIENKFATNEFSKEYDGYTFR